MKQNDPLTAITMQFWPPGTRFLGLLQKLPHAGEGIACKYQYRQIADSVCRPLGEDMYEARTSLDQNRIARVLFYIDKKSRMVLLHGFIKKTQKAADKDLKLAKRNMKKHQRGLQ